MKWFETKEIRKVETLSERQAAFLREPSIAIFGPFNVLFRGHFDFLLTGLAIYIALGFVLTSLFSVPIESPLLLLASYVPYVVLAYFGVRHGRRLSWNRREWKDFKEFQESEGVWVFWGWIGLGALLLWLAVDTYTYIQTL